MIVGCGSYLSKILLPTIIKICSRVNMDYIRYEVLKF